MRAQLSWTEDRVETLLGHLKAGKTTTQIGNCMGLSRSAVSGQINRMKQKDKGRLMAAGYAVMSARGFDGGRYRKELNAKLAEDLAELVSQDMSIRAAAVNMGISHSHAFRLFDRICNGLGAQAQ